jgi:glutamate-1-semialdehyde 2,1-aminomutase
MAAGIATLDGIVTPGFYSQLAEKTSQLVTGIAAAARSANIPFSTNHVCGMFGLFFSKSTAVQSYEQVMQCDVERFKKFYHGMLAEGVYLAPSAFEAGFVSIAHSDADIDATVSAAKRVCAAL